MADDRNDNKTQSDRTSSGQSGKSDADRAQMRDRELIKGGAGDAVLGNPGQSGKRPGGPSGGQGNVTEQSAEEADREGASRQTSTAQDEKGQL